jgi:lipopolysaccharide/colanic/teichoic acid biosynthesis glycosyltransferase
VAAAAEQLTASPAIARTQPRVDRYTRPWTIALVTGDVISFLLSAWGGASIVRLLAHERLDASRVGLSVAVYVGLWLWLFERLGLYERSFATSIQDEIYATIAALSVGIAPQLILFSLVPSLSSSRLVLLCSFGLSIAAVTTTRAIAHRVRRIEALDRERRLALIGAPDRLRAVSEELRLVPNVQITTVAVEDLDLAMATEDTSLPGAFEGMPWFAKALRWECDSLIFTDVPDPRHIPGLLAAARKWGLQVAFATPRIRAYSYQFVADVLGHQTIIVPRPIRAVTPAARFVKRAIDVGVAFTGLVVTAPLAMLCAVALACEGGGILRREPGTGRDGRSFQLLRFRTTAPDGRTSRVGGMLVRLCLDGLPQLVNVVRGEMSIVGPRPRHPAAVEAVRAFNPRYSDRSVVRPGMTGWAQVRFPFTDDRHADAERELAYELFYVENWGLLLDAYIVVKATLELAVRMGSTLP